MTHAARYISTRGTPDGQAVEALPGFRDILLSGLAPDGGLYVPAAWPKVLPSQTLRDLEGADYCRLARAVLAPFIGADIPGPALDTIMREAWGSFAHRAVTPLVQLDRNLFALELWHGPTLAFKDLAMRFLAGAMDFELERRAAAATILCATSGDTGAAAVAAFAARRKADLYVLYPHGRISQVQRRQMTCEGAQNVHALAIDGDFDDCQNLVKALFGDAGFCARYSLCAVNSINWARILAQAVYFVAAALALGGAGRAISFVVPTGNFGNIYAGFVAARLGLDVHRLVIATNRNDILVRAIEGGRYEIRKAHGTSAPSMDIQISSNFERLLFAATKGDGACVARMMGDLAVHRAFTIDAALLERIRADFGAAAASEEDIAGAMRDCYRHTGYVLDPHSAAGYHVACLHAPPDTPVVLLCTAHPAKFPDAAKAAFGPDMKAVAPQLRVARLEQLFDAREHMAHMPASRSAVMDYIARTSRFF